MWREENFTFQVQVNAGSIQQNRHLPLCSKESTTFVELHKAYVVICFALGFVLVNVDTRQTVKKPFTKFPVTTLVLRTQ